MSEPSFEDLRKRAYELADTGRFASWNEVGAALEAEDVALASKRLRADPVLTHMLTARCEQARDRFGR